MKDGLPTDREIFHIAGIDGRSVATDRGLLSLQKRFEDIIAAHPGKTYYNATMAGVHIEGTEPASLARLVEQYMSSSLPVGEFVEKAVRVQPPFPVTAFLKQSADILKSISKIEGQLSDVLALSGNARREIARLRKNRSPIHGFDSLPASLAKKLSKFDRINKTLDAAGTINEHILELTYPVLSENDRWRERNEEVRERDGYLPWLLAEVERIEMVNKERHKAFVLYRNVLGNLTRHLVYEEECLARLAATRNEKEYLALVRLYAESGDYQLANGMIEQALALTPLCAEAHLLAGDVRAGLLDFSTANDAWRTALRLAPELAVKVSAVRRRHAEFWIRIADEHGNVGETGDNFPQLLPTWLGRVAEILADEEEIPDMLQQLWQKHAAQMEEWLAIGENGHVELVLRGWESFSGRFPELLVFRARYLAMQGDPVAAVAAMKRALVRKPAEPQWLAFLSRLLLEAGRFEEGNRPSPGSCGA
jgi:tetratricopeptide (TPR) repeat protein